MNWMIDSWTPEQIFWFGLAVGGVIVGLFWLFTYLTVKAAERRMEKLEKERPTPSKTRSKEAQEYIDRHIALNNLLEKRGLSVSLRDDSHD